MPVTYNTIEVTKNQPPTQEVWSTTWPGQDGCGDRVVYYGSPISFPGPPLGVSQWYEPEVSFISKDPIQYKGRRAGYPPFRFTPYGVSKVTYRKFLVKRLNGTNGRNIYKQFGTVPRVAGSCTPTISRVECTGPQTTLWNDVTHTYVGAPSYTTSSISSADISSALTALQAQLTAKALTSYDALTDVAEAREIPGLVRDIAKDLYSVFRILRGRYDRRTLRFAATLTPLQLLKHPVRTFRKLGNEWMAYRYGIMPLVYSYRDMQKIVDRQRNIIDRVSTTISPKDTGVYLPDASSQFKRVSTEGNVTVRGEIFQYFLSTEDARLTSIGMNPLVTAWELIPYSFVADWFVNVGDYIAAKTAMPMKGTRWACLSRRDNYRVCTDIHLPAANKTITFGNSVPTNWWGAQPPATPSQVLSNPEGYYPLEEVETNSYTRWLFTVGDAQLTLAPHLNWKRGVDSSVMALNQLSSLIRRMRKG